VLVVVIIAVLAVILLASLCVGAIAAQSGIDLAAGDAEAEDDTTLLRDIRRELRRNRPHLNFRSYD
jgi:hypothetical protein